MNVSRFSLVATVARFILMFHSMVVAVAVASESLSDPIGPPLVHTVPSFKVTDLRAGVGFGRLREALTTTGLIALSLDNGEEFENLRKTALGGLCQCASSSSGKDFTKLEGSDSILLGDGQTTRSTLATATLGRSPLPLTSELPNICGAETAQAMDLLRDQVAHASATFIEALDELLLREERFGGASSGQPLLHNSYGGSYHTISSIVQASSNLEHFHIYSKEDKPRNEQVSSRPALQMHTDAGLFLAFVPAHDCATAEDRDKSFYLQVPSSVSSHEIMQALFPRGSIAIMLGAGAEHWLKSPERLSLRATHHSIQMEAGDSRAWYGMMHLVPDSAILDQTFHAERTFSDLREAMVLKSHTKTSRRFGDDPINFQSNGEVSIGCGLSDPNTQSRSSDDKLSVAFPAQPHRRRLSHVENAGACNNETNFYCWMSCLDVPQADEAERFIAEDYSLYCVDPSVLASSGSVGKAVEPCTQQGIVGLAMNSNCLGMWQPTAPGVTAQYVNVKSATDSSDVEEPFCYGGTSMYMDGFQWVGTVCPIYLFPRLVLNSAEAIVAACFFTIIFGISLEWVIQRRRATVQQFAPGYKRLFVSAAFYGIQLTMGYSIMLVVMIYSIPLFLSVVIGIVSGHILFSAPDALVKEVCACGDVRSPIANSSEVIIERYDGAHDDDFGGDVHGSKINESRLSTDGSSTAGSGTSCAIPGQHFAPMNATQRKGDLEVAEGSTPCCQHTL